VSIYIMSRLFKAQLGSASRKMLAVRLADFADDEGKGIWPTVARLSFETELSERTVQRTLRDFVEEGLLVVVREASGRPGSATRYDFDLTAIEKLPDAKTPVDGCHHVTGVTMSPVTLATETGDTDDGDGCHHDTRTVIEPLLEPLPEREGAGEILDKEDPKRINRDFKRWHPTWPTFVSDGDDNARKAWFALTADERAACIDRTPAYIAAVKASGRTKWFAASTYLASKAWEKLSDPRSDVAPPSVHNPFSRAWHAMRLAELLKPMSPAMPPLTSFQRDQVAAGGEVARRIERQRREKYGWPKVNTMDQRAEGAQGVTVPPQLFAISESFEKVRRDSDLAARWRAFHERMGWPWVPDAGRLEWLFLPAGEPEDAIADFEKRVNEGLGQ